MRELPLALKERKAQGEINPLKSTTGQWEILRKAFEAISYFLNNNVLQNLEVHTLADINKHYRATLREIVGHDDLLPTTQKLQQKLELELHS